MKVVEISESFGLDRLVVARRDDPVAGPGQLLLRMRAASLNYRDLLMTRGQYNPKQPLPLIPCSDGVGQVVAVGSGVDRVAVGDRVSPIFAQGWLSGDPTWDIMGTTLGGPLDGTLTELMQLDAEGVVRVPEHLSDEEAASLPCAGVTAWNALSSLEEGGTVLVQGTGGVSTFALQFARLRGAQAIVISGSDEKLERARELGAWETINYRTTTDWGKEARKLSGTGVDLVVDVCGAATLAQSVAAVRPGGQISLIGNLSGGRSELNFIPIFMRQIRVQGVFVGPRSLFEEMNREIEAQAMRPVVGRVFPLDEARAALEHLAAAEHYGKIAIRIG